MPPAMSPASTGPGSKRSSGSIPTATETPTLGRERSFLEDLFGNIGAVGAPGTGGGAPAAAGGPNGS